MYKLIISMLILLSISGPAFATPEFYFAARTGYYQSGGLFKLDQDTGSLQKYSTTYRNFRYIARYDDDHVMVADGDSYQIRVYTEDGTLVNSYNPASGGPSGIIMHNGHIYYNTFYGMVGYINVTSGVATDLGVYYNRDCSAITVRTNGDLFVIDDYADIQQVLGSSILHGSGYYDMTAGADNYLFVNNNYHTLLAIDETNTVHTAWTNADITIYDIDYDPVDNLLYGFGTENGLYNLYKFIFDDTTDTFSSSILVSNITNMPQYYGDFMVTHSGIVIPEPLSIGLLGVALGVLLRRLKS